MSGCLLIINRIDQSDLLRELGALTLRLGPDGSVSVEPCDPHGRAEMLERAIAEFLSDWDNPHRLDLAGHHVMGTVMIEALNGLRAALACKPAQLKGGG